jgi:hypothetical protein
MFVGCGIRKETIVFQVISGIEKYHNQSYRGTGLSDNAFLIKTEDGRLLIYDTHPTYDFKIGDKILADISCYCEDLTGVWETKFEILKIRKINDEIISDGADRK